MRKAQVKKTIGKARQRTRAASLRLTPTGRRRRGRLSKVARASLSPPTASLADAQPSADLMKSEAGLDLTQKVKDLLRLAKEQGNLTYEDLKNALPDAVATPADLDQVLTKLRGLEVEIIDAAEVERGQPADAEAEEEGNRYDFLRKV